MANNQQKQHKARLRGILKHDLDTMNDIEQGRPVRHVPPVTQPISKAKPLRDVGIKFDETNIVETLHPINKDYGHMKINEPKTPYEGKISNDGGIIDPEQLMIKLANMNIQQATKDISPAQKDDFEVPATAGFQEARKLHYNEYRSVKDARKLIDDEMGEIEPFIGTGPRNEAGPSKEQTKN